MSTAALQSALIRLVKAPAIIENTSVEDFLKQYDLNEIETKQLREIISDKFLPCFAKDQQDKRFGFTISTVYKKSLEILNKDEVFKVYQNEFEPLHTHIEEDDISENFKNFLKTHSLITSLPEDKKFVSDLMDYEYSEFLVFGGRIERTWSISEQSLAKQESPFVLADFEYDISEYMRQTDENAVPVKRKNTLLFILQESHDKQEMNQFEVDDSVSQFLRSQIEGPTGLDHSLPECYEDLVELGLCKPLS